MRRRGKQRKEKKRKKEELESDNSKNTGNSQGIFCVVGHVIKQSCRRLEPAG